MSVKLPNEHWARRLKRLSNARMRQFIGGEPGPNKVVLSSMKSGRLGANFIDYWPLW